MRHVCIPACLRLSTLSDRQKRNSGTDEQTGQTEEKEPETRQTAWAAGQNRADRLGTNSEPGQEPQGGQKRILSLSLPACHLSPAYTTSHVSNEQTDRQGRQTGRQTRTRQTDN